MSIFQITPRFKRGQVINYDVLIIKDGEQKKQYSDTLDNFKLDSGLTLNNLTEVIYNDELGHCVINKKFVDFPNSDFDNYIENIDMYITAQEKRTYVAPPEPTQEEIKTEQINKIYADNNAQLDSIKDAMLVAVLTDDTELQTELKQEYADLIADTNKQLEEVNAND